MNLDKECVSKHDITHIKFREFVYTWQITNFKFYDFKDRKRLYSPNFVTDDNNEYEFCLALYSNGCDEEHEDYLSTVLSMTKNSPDKTIYLILSLVDRNGAESHVSLEKFIDLKYLKTDQRTFEKFVKRSYVLDPSNQLLSNATLTIKCKLYFVNNIVHVPHSTKIFLPTEMLSNDLERLLDNTKFSDVKLVVGDKELNVHKNILTSRSRVFAAMFEHNLKEQLENIVIIKDIDYEVMRQVLYFMYTERIKEDIEISDDLLLAADMYDLQGLQILCEDSLIKNLSLENVCKVLRFVNNHKLDRLEKATIKFIENHVKELADSKKFKSEMNLLSPLLAELINIFLKNR